MNTLNLSLLPSQLLNLLTSTLSAANDPLDCIVAFDGVSLEDCGSFNSRSSYYIVLVESFSVIYRLSVLLVPSAGCDAAAGFMIII